MLLRSRLLPVVELTTKALGILIGKYIHGSQEDVPINSQLPMQNSILGDIGKMYGLEDYEGSPYPKHFLAHVFMPSR